MTHRLLSDSAHRRTGGDRISVLLVHGWQNRRPEGHWQRWLNDRLTAARHQVVYPQLPDPNEPVLEEWMRVVGDSLSALTEPRRLVVGHSLGCLAWLHYVAEHPGIEPVDGLALVAPPSPDVVLGIPAIKGFAFHPELNSPLGAVEARLVHSHDDSYCPEGADAVYGHLFGLEADLLPGQGHFDMEAGYGSWPELLAWCLGQERRIGARSDVQAAV